MQPVQSASERSWADSGRPVDNQGALNEVKLYKVILHNKKAHPH